MNLLLLALLIAAPMRAPSAAVPAALTDPEPGMTLTWRALDLEPGENTGRPAARSFRLSVHGASVIRLTGSFAARCEPAAYRWVGDDQRGIDVPLAVSASKSDRIVALPPSLAGTTGEDNETQPTIVRVALESGCETTALHAFAAVLTPDDYALTRMALALRRLVGQPNTPNDVASWLQGPFPHRWQQAAALAVVLPALLDSDPDISQAGHDPAPAHALASAWLEEALAEARAEDPTFARLRPLPTGDRPILTTPAGEALAQMQPGAPLDLDVAGEEALRLFHRSGPGAGDAGASAWSVSIAFDGATAVSATALAGQDPEAPGWSRLRSTVVPIPAGARRARVMALGRVIGLRGSTIWHKPHLEDLVSRRSATDWLAQAASNPNRPEPRGRLVAALARIQSGDQTAAADAFRLAAADPLATSLAALLAGEHATDPAVAAARAARAASALDSITAPIARAARPLLRARVARLRARLALAAGNPTQAAAALGEIVSTPTVCDEDGFALAAADVMSDGPPGFETRAQALLDGLLARRPLDHALWVERARLQALATGWHALPSPPGADLLAFLDRVAADAPPGRTAFLPLPQDHEVTIEVPAALLPGRQPVLSLLAARGDGLAAAATVRIDGAAAVSLPLLLPLERFELPISPGRHELTLDPGAFAGQLFSNFAVASGLRQSPARDGFRFRRYAALARDGTAWPLPEVGTPGLVQLSFRAVAAAGTDNVIRGDETVTIEVRGLGRRPITLRLRPGSAHSGSLSDLPAGTLVTEPVEVALPSLGKDTQLALFAQPARGLRLFAHVAIRRNRPIEIAAITPHESLLADTDAALGHAGQAWQAVADLGAQLAHDQTGRASIYLARAQILAELDEHALAREDLLAARGDSGLGPHQLALVSEIWRRLDDLGNGPAASVPNRAPSPSITLALAPGGPRLPAGLLGLLDDATALASAPPAELRRRAGVAGDLAVLHAARLAEARGDRARTAQLWQDLSLARPELSAVRREAGAALLRLGDHPGAAARAYLDLWAAVRLDPRDTEARRLFRHAGWATRLRPLRLPEQSAGNEPLHLASDSGDLEAAQALLPALPGSGSTMLITGDRAAVLSFRLPVPMRLSLRADAVDLRPSLARATGALPVALLSARDGRAQELATCAAGRGQALLCTPAPIDLPAGLHNLSVRLSGGARAAARLGVTLKGAARPGRASRAAAPAFATDFGITAEQLLARPEAPVRLHVHGPALLRIEARVPLRPTARATPPLPAVVLVSARAPGLAPITTAMHPLAVADPGAVRASGDPVSPPAIEFLALERDALYLLEVRPAAGTALIRLAVRDGASETERPPDRSGAPQSYRTESPLLTPAPPALDQALAFEIEDGVVPPGAAQFGSVGIGFGLARRLRNAEGAVVQTSSAAVTSLTWRRLFDDAHVTAKAGLEMRARADGSPAQWLDADLFYLDPARRWLRLLLTADLATQQIQATRAWAGEIAGMVEPVTTLLPGLHLVGKAGAWTSLHSLAGPDPALLPQIDPDVYNRFAVAHPRGLFLESGLEIEPLANLVLYGNARLTSNASFSPLDQDHVSASLIARALFGRLYAEASARSSWFYVDRDRPDPVALHSLFFSLFHTLWFSGRQRCDVGMWTGLHLDQRATELSFYVAWEGSNGRGFRDHTPLEGENYFFAQRGPGAGGGRLKLAGPP